GLTSTRHGPATAALMIVRALALWRKADRRWRVAGCDGWGSRARCAPAIASGPGSAQAAGSAREHARRRRGGRAPGLHAVPAQPGDGPERLHRDLGIHL